ncbi:MAG TPA: hypothetical protein VKG82_09565 [Solirubrobacteraceae bacterium]|nr:hypothetical protein [Solirubrobacteraceae bacterium]
MLLSELTAPAPRLALVGLAKNTGKTVALTALLSELAAAGRTVGVTSVGRDGEEHDVIDSRIEKPRVWLRAGSIVASTDVLLRASALPHEVLERTGARTPLGTVLIARLRGEGTLEVAGPSTAAGVRAACDAMLGYGAEQVLIDGAIDRRAASSPDVADGLVISTGAVLSEDIDEVVSRTRDAVELVRLARVAHEPRARMLAIGPHSALLGEHGEHAQLPPRFALTASAADISAALDDAPQARWMLVAGALPEHFVRELAHLLHRRARELTLVLADSTKAFLSEHGPGWYAGQGLQIEVLEPISLRALTVNPIAPRSHSFDSAQLRELLHAAIGDIAIFDVMSPDYRGSRPAAIA